MPENEPEPDREFVYPMVKEIILPRLVEVHDIFIDDLSGLNNEED
jgi:hypothetical protein